MTDQSPELLAALNNVAAWAEYQKKITKWTLWALVPFLIIGLGIVLSFKNTISDTTRPPDGPIEWYDVRQAAQKGDLQAALRLADELLQRIPLDFDGHYTKGEILLMLGERDAALASFKKAAEIFPIPRHTAAVEALSAP